MALRQPRVDPKLMTEAELMALGEDARVEVLDGEVIEMSPNGMQHHLIAVQVWVIYPKPGELHQYRRDGPTVAPGKRGETLDAEALLPSLTLPLDFMSRLSGME